MVPELYRRAGNLRKKLVNKTLLLWCFLLLAACNRHNETLKARRHFPLTGKIVALDAQHRVATIDAAAIPNYMEAMTMDYPISPASNFEALHVGDSIRGTLDVADDDRYALSNIKVVASQAK